MSEEKLKFLSYEEAAKLVGAIQEEEDIERANKRILTVYSKEDIELCWFDFEEVKAAVGDVEAGDKKAAVEHYVLHHIPDWVYDI
jgi:hypothetical protein